KVEKSLGIRLNTDYYYWPGSWVQDRPGMFTGSGMPMRFADLDGTIIDNYQVTTQMTDESGITIPVFINTLLDNAIGTKGYYGVFCANMHTDLVSSSGSDAIIASAQARQIPVISAKQMLTWLDGRNSSSFSALNWNGNTLNFSVNAGVGAYKLQGMVPVNASGTLQLTGITYNGSAVGFTTEVIKGVNYAFFDANNGNYAAVYGIGTAMAPNRFTEANLTDGSNTRVNSRENNHSYFLGQNYPNPGNQFTTITYTVSVNTQVELSLFDLQGRKIKGLVNEIKKAGVHRYSLDVRNLSKGIYLYKMQTAEFSDTKRLIVE
ncbi:MAG: T9SS type A sorting domain-containing protein, partial [Chitinophagaceae bacterium]